MTFDRLAPMLMAALLASAGAMTLCAAWQVRGLSALAAALSAILCVAAAVHLNAPLWHAPADGVDADAPRAALRQSTLLIVLVYAWGAIALFLIYRISGLYWRHGWQYGLAAALLAAAHANSVRRLAREPGPEAVHAATGHAVKLAAAEGLAIAVALLWLVGSGKLNTLKGDWAANQIFLSGGFAVVCLTAIIVKTHASLTRP